ncbi:hypothetical protein BV25DRAFT_1824881 [Artomyces pyxidatus]|uniref:Uncharacterized protein n=1 Tax=Artomyces pyxidatus TaxID=48021 RepID=A0ACB8T238_9AGAM|nr:hypothetical protein BV25DRAFT_1824881 [Artomyces pyxidatus]
MGAFPTTLNVQIGPDVILWYQFHRAEGMSSVHQGFGPICYGVQSISKTDKEANIEITVEKNDYVGQLSSTAHMGFGRDPRA